MSIKVHPQIKHFIIMLAIIVVFWVCPPFHSSLTPLGMKLLGILIACCYGWCFGDIGWSSMLCLFAIPFTGAISINDLLANSFGNNLVVFLIFVLMFGYLMEASGLIEFIAYWLLSRNFVSGKPWRLLLFFMIAAAIATALAANVFMTQIFMFSLAVKILGTCGYKKGDTAAKVMITATTCACMCGYFAFPWGGINIILLGAISSITGIEVNYVDFLMFSIPVAVATLLIYWLILRFIYRPDLTLLKNYDSSQIEPEKLILSVQAKLVGAVLIAFVLILTIASLFPQSPIGMLFNTLGMAGTLILVMLPLLFIKVGDKRVWSVPDTFRNGVNFESVLACAFLIPFGTLLSAEDAGVSSFFLALLQPIMQNATPFTIAMIIVIFAMILTQFMANLTAAYIFLPMIYAMSLSIGFDPIVQSLLACYGAHIAILLPAASAYSAVTHAHPWSSSSATTRYGLGFFVTGFIVSIAAYFYLPIIF